MVLMVAVLVTIAADEASPAPPRSPGGEISSRLVLPRPRGALSGGGTIGIALLWRFCVIGRGTIFCSSVL